MRPVAPLANSAMVAAKAAPVNPQPNGKINSQPSITVMIAAMILHIIANFGAPSKRIMNRQTEHHIWNINEGMNHNRYSLTMGVRCSEAPKNRAVADGYAIIKADGTMAAMVTNNKA